MSASPELNEIVGNYAIERPLAHGSMGHVYVARHTLTHARVALKVLRSELARDSQAEERFLREVRAAAHIGHDGIVKVYDAGRSRDGLLYLAMELLRGETLEDRMTRQYGDRLPVLDWLLRVLEPLAAAHEQGIVHRDLKPANVFIARGADGNERVKLLDFGLARDTREKSGTETGIALGTPYYMSPEQATRPKHVGPASDVWSMGVMLYEVLSGRMPFEGETLHAVVINSTTTAHVPLQEHQPRLDPALYELVEACLSKEPTQRPADATELLARLGPLLAEPALREELAIPLAIEPPPPGGDAASNSNGQSDSGSAPSQRDASAFADTAISLTPRLVDSDMRPVPRRRSNVLWISTLALLAIATAGFVWVLERASGDRARGEPPSSDARANETKTPAGPVFTPPSPGAAGSPGSAESNTAAPKRPSKPEPARNPASKSKTAASSSKADPTRQQAKAAEPKPEAKPSGEPSQPSAADAPAPPEGSTESAPEIDPVASQSAPDAPISAPPAAPIDEPPSVDLPPPEPPEPNSAP
jgi:serine/threonine-protein kinase